MEGTSSAPPDSNTSTTSSSTTKPFHSKRYSNNRGSGNQNASKPKKLSQIRYTDRVYVPKNRPDLVQQAQQPGSQAPSNEGQISTTDPAPSTEKGESNNKNRRKRGAKSNNNKAPNNNTGSGDETVRKEKPSGEGRERTWKPKNNPRQNKSEQNAQLEDEPSTDGSASRGKKGGRGNQTKPGGRGRGEGKRPKSEKPHQNWSRGKPDTSEHSDMAGQMIQALTRNTYECMVCTEKVQRNQNIWHCERCYALFHLTCIKQWSKKSKEAKEETARQLNKSGPKTLEWNCPHCNNHNRGQPKPRCFCGKVANPEFNPYITPHSCGEVCGRMREQTDCPHSCQLPCHPGSCPPCSLLGPTRHCHCGAEEYRLGCGQPDPGRSCNRVCNKMLNCGRHRCTAICHPGSCERCAQPMEQKCYCGKEHGTRVCGTDVIDDAMGEERHFSCGVTCDRLLECGNHRCQEKCHPGECKECALLPQNVMTCPCGSTDLLFLGMPRASCLDPIPCCSKVCGKKLHCGEHTCPKTCHEGPCPPCAKKVNVKCRCGAQESAFDCVKVFPPKEAEAKDAEPFSFECERMCNQLRVCGRHRCNIKCCPSRQGADALGAHVCQIPCNKLLKCGVHKCKMLCHKGRCSPCREASFDDLSCSCGRTVMSAPIPCGTEPPVCEFPCHRSAPCGHALSAHKCHTDKVACPPCTVLVEKMCMGEHEKRRNILCHLKDISCGSVCGKPLPCGLHRCNRTCHRPPCLLPKVEEEKEVQRGRRRGKERVKEKEKEKEDEYDKDSESDSSDKESPEIGNKESETTSTTTTTTSPWDEAPSESLPQESKPSCGQICGASLKTCVHTCPALCHPGRPCPNIVCQQMVTIYCPCKRRSLEVTCLRGGEHKEVSEDDEEARVEKRQLSCNENCEREKRNQRLAEAFGTRPSSSHPPAAFPEELLEVAKVNSLKFIQEIEKVFETLIKSESERKHSFKPMKKAQRTMIHELAQYYSLDAQSFDPEPNRNVVVTKKLASRIPHVLLSTALSSGMTISTVTKKNVPAPWEEENGDSTTLHIYDLTLDVKTEHLAAFLSPFAGEYTLRWVDPYNALAIFDDRDKYKLALQILGKEEKGNMFKVKPYEIPATAWLFKRRQMHQQQQQASPQAPTKPPPKNPWKVGPPESDKKVEAPGNVFSVLDRTGGVPDPLSAAPPRPNLSNRTVKERWDDEDENEGATTTTTTTTTPPAPKDASWRSVADKPGPLVSGGKQEQEWACTLCTFKNHHRATKCAMCENPNPFY